MKLKLVTEINLASQFLNSNIDKHLHLTRFLSLNESP